MLIYGDRDKVSFFFIQLKWWYFIFYPCIGINQIQPIVLVKNFRILSSWKKKLNNFLIIKSMNVGL